MAVTVSYHGHRGMRARMLNVIGLTCLSVLIGCGPSRSTEKAGPKPTTQADAASAKRYNLTGRVVSIDKSTQSINVDGDAIPGFMAAMTMPYQVKDVTVLDKLSPGDQIKAEIVVGNEAAYLENIIPVQKAASPSPAK